MRLWFKLFIISLLILACSFLTQDLAESEARISLTKLFRICKGPKLNFRYLNSAINGRFSLSNIIFGKIFGNRVNMCYVKLSRKRPDFEKTKPAWSCRDSNTIFIPVQILR